ncbi:hypothetical protein Hanom_Chr05g00412901 [Helianthus anomalus]
MAIFKGLGQTVKVTKPQGAKRKFTLFLLTILNRFILPKHHLSSSYLVNPTNSKAKVGSEEGRCRQPYLYPVGIERLLPMRPPARL